ncbi:MAG: 3-oxoacyl-ACP synthase [Eubacteriales bacterium]|jgi:3-oxoacyl-[acyl-carrier-protein] synthase-3|nr:3-oxoacyl-ACP synthase [Eubacteriales bacterium]MDD4133972.1 3-oxoacyl-ACP synthase [Eubacteriales bacterium]
MKNHVGIVGTGVYLPKGVMTSAEIAEKTNGVWAESAVREKLGIRQKLIPTDPGTDGTQEMGALAALDCLKNTGIDPKDIDVILCIGEEWKEYPLTTSALYIQDRIGAVNAWGIDVQNRCCTCVSAMKIAKDMLLADDEINTVLVAGGYRNSDFLDYTDRNMSMMYNLGAGGGAILLQKNLGKNLLLGSHIISDGSLARTAGVRIGGTAEPITCKNVDEAYKSLRLFEPEKMKKRLNEVSAGNWVTCIEKSLEKSSLTLKDLNYLAILHIKRSGHLGMLKDLGLTEDQAIYLEDYGHIGQIDQILSLHLALGQGKVKDGSVACMLAAGIGYVWAANIIKWGPVSV